MFLSHAWSKVSKIKNSQSKAPETWFGKGRSNTEQLLSGLDPVSFTLPEYWQFCISLICDKSFTTQNLAFLSYWYRKIQFAGVLLTGIVS
jgi:hypothetical protein